MPVRYVLVSDTRRHIEHNDTTLAIDVVPVSQAAELLLPSCVPHVELNLSQILQRRLASSD